MITNICVIFVKDIPALPYNLIYITITKNINHKNLNQPVLTFSFKLICIVFKIQFDKFSIQYMMNIEYMKEFKRLRKTLRRRTMGSTVLWMNHLVQEEEVAMI